MSIKWDLVYAEHRSRCSMMVSAQMHSMSRNGCRVRAAKPPTRVT